MRKTLLTGAAALVAAAAIAGPAQAAQAPTPQIAQVGKCTVRHSNEYKGFTYANCLITVNNAPQGAIKINYKSNLKTYSPQAEFGPFNKQSGTFTLRDGEIRGIELAFPGKTAAQVKKSLKITLSSPTAGVTGAVATA